LCYFFHSPTSLGLLLCVEKIRFDARVVLLSDIGVIATKQWEDIQRERISVEIDEFIVMPNHLHGVLKIKNHVKGQEYSLRKRGAINRALEKAQILSQEKLFAQKESAINRARTKNPRSPSVDCQLKNPMYYPRSLSSIIRSYKARVTRTVRKIEPEFSWQRNFYDVIIRNEKHLNNVRKYIQNNPTNY